MDNPDDESDGLWVYFKLTRESLAQTPICWILSLEIVTKFDVESIWTELFYYCLIDLSIYIVTSVKAGYRKSGGIIHSFFLVKLCQLEVRGFDIKIEF